MLEWKRSKCSYFLVLFISDPLQEYNMGWACFYLDCSIREICAKEDIDIAYKHFKAFYQSFSSVDKMLTVDTWGSVDGKISTMFLRWLWIQSPNKLISLLELKQMDYARILFCKYNCVPILSICPKRTCKYIKLRHEFSCQQFLDCWSRW